MIKKFFVAALALSLAVVLNASAQESTNEGIVFEQGTFDQAMAKAKELRRPLFVDCYTSWCGPCKVMSNTVFTQKSVGDYFNAEFVNMKIDMEKGEGVELKTRFNVTAYPTFLFIDSSSGEVLHRMLGSSSAEEFVARTQSGLDGNNVTAMTKRYDQGERDEEFLKTYLSVLNDAGENKKSAEVGEAMLQAAPEKVITDRTYFELFVNYIEDPYSPVFQNVLKNKQIVVDNFGERIFDLKTSRTWYTYGRSLVGEQADGKWAVDEKKLKQYQSDMAWLGADKDMVKKVELNTRIYACEKQGTWSKYADYVDKMITMSRNDNIDMELYNWALRIEQNSADKRIRERAAEWLDNRLMEMSIEEAKIAADGGMAAMSMMKPALQKMAAQLKADKQ